MFRRTLKLHMAKMHEGVRPYICHHCGAAHHDASGLRKHLLTHEGPTNYQCQLCGYGSAVKVHFNGQSYSGRYLLYYFYV